MRFLQTAPRLLIDPGLVEGGGAAYFGNLQLYFDRDLPIGLRVAADESASFGATLPNLTTAWEVSDRALILMAGGHTVMIPGPTHSTNQTSDTGTEPYDWLPHVDTVTDIEDWIMTFLGLSQADRDATTITFDDGLASEVHALAADFAFDPLAFDVVTCSRKHRMLSKFQ